MTLENLFTKKDKVLPRLLALLDAAEERILVAVAWFTEPNLFHKLLKKQQAGVRVELIITKHAFNTKSANQYAYLEKAGGFFAELGSEEQYMHMKFCVIDQHTVISGSANWTYKAFHEHNEQVSIVRDHPQQVADFEAAFEQLKKETGHTPEQKAQLKLSKILPQLEIIKQLIVLEDAATLATFIERLEEYAELKDIVHPLKAAQYALALEAIQTFQKRNQQITVQQKQEEHRLRHAIRILQHQITALEISKTELEDEITQFERMHLYRLRPLILKLKRLELRIQKQFKDRGLDNGRYDQLMKELNEEQTVFEEELEDAPAEISEEEEKDLQTTFREAVKMCHPDVNDGTIAPEEAGAFIAELSKAYKCRDKQRVQAIHHQLKMKRPLKDIPQRDLVTLLKAEYSSLKMRHKSLVEEIASIELSEIYQFIQEIEDWDDFFEQRAEEIQEKYNQLESKYFKT